MKKGKLRLDRITLQQLSPSEVAAVRGGVNPSDSCKPVCTTLCTWPTNKSFCVKTDCCLIKP
jgi:hypothetical protein